jgi:hypothetical protein
MTQSIWPWPWLTGSTAAQAPLSGDVSQWLRFFSPTINVNGRGDPELEGAIVRDVATYGSQIGQLTALVLAMADDKPLPPDALAKLKHISEQIEQLKATHRGDALEKARDAMQELVERDPAAVPRVLSEFSQQH